MVDGDQSSGAGAGRTPPLGARGRSSSFPNLAQNAFVAALGVGDGAPRDAAAGAAPAGGSDVGEVAPARASAAWYLPPLGLRHLSEVRARNLVPPRGAEHSRGAGFRFTLATGGGAGEPEAVVYTSEVATDTLNPDWEPLDDADLERRVRRVVGAASSSSHECADLNNTDDATADATDHRGVRTTDLKLTVWHVENPARGGTERAVFTTRLALDDLTRMRPNSTASSTRASVFGPFDGSADADGVGLTPLGGASVSSPPLAFPPNTPMVRLLPRRTRWGLGGGLGGYDMAGYGGGGGVAGWHHSWHVPGGRSWRALRDDAHLADAADAADAEDAVDALDASRASAEGGGVEGGSRAAGGGGGKESTSGSPLSRAGAGSGAAVGRIERADARALRASIDAIVHAAAGVARATLRRDALRDAVGERLGSAEKFGAFRGTRTPSRPSLAALRGMLVDAKLDVAALRRDVEAHREDARRRTAVNAKRRESLVAGDKRLARARVALGENAAALAGARGRGRLHQQQRALVARRWRLVADLARVFPIAPVRSGGDDDGGGGGGGGVGGGTGGKQKRSWMVAGVPLDLGQSGKPNGAGSLSAAIGHGLLPGSTVSQSEQERRASALGYVTQAVLQLAAVLDVPLRYPVAPGASRSYICDLQQTWASSHASRGDRLGGGSGVTDRYGPGSPNAGEGSSSSAYTERAVMWRRYEFPLFADGASGSAESTKFTYAVFLLNKDLEQLLNAHGLLAVGPRQTLPNLRRLLHGRTNRCEVVSAAAAGGGGGEVDESVASRVASGEENGGGGYEATVALTR